MQRPGGWVVLDEVQRLPALLDEGHRCIGDLGLRLVVLGSSARELKAAGTNLLAGRAVRRRQVPEATGFAWPASDRDVAR